MLNCNSPLCPLVISTLLQNFCNTKQKIKECILKLCGYIYHQGTYTPQASNAKGTGFLAFTGVSTLLQNFCNTKQETEECTLKLSGYIYHQGTYTPLWGVGLYRIMVEFLI